MDKNGITMNNFEKEIDIITKNIGKTINVNLSSVSTKCTVIGYGIIEKTIASIKSTTINVLVVKETPSHYKFPWQTELEKYVVLHEKDFNPDDFLAIPYYCVKTNKNNEFLSCY